MATADVAAAVAIGVLQRIPVLRPAIWLPAALRVPTATQLTARQTASPLVVTAAKPAGEL